MQSVLLQADIPGPNTYINLFKIAGVLVLFTAWAFAFQWVDRDTDFVKTKRERWNLIVMCCGIGGLAVLFLIPWFGSLYFLGVGFFVVLAAGALLAYVVHRNGRVVPDHRVLTIGHFKRLMTSDPSAAAAKLDKGQRIQLADEKGATVNRPLERGEFELYDATQDFLYDALWRRATDVEVLAGKDKSRVVYRIDGVASERQEPLSIEDGERVVTYLKALAGLNPEEIRRPQEGRVQASLLADTDLNKISVHTSGSTTGERMRLRVIRSASKMRLDDLGLQSQRLEKLRELISQSKGLVLISGPAGSGVTTTQYAILRAHDAFMTNIHLLEKKTLYDLDNITQATHKPGAEQISYARQLQSVLRREPDIVGIGECEDRETAQIALRAAQDDRKVYMAIDGKSAFDALSRLVSLAEDPKLAAKALKGVLCQRLIRVLCKSCRQTFKPDENLLRKANLPANKIENFYRPPTEPVFDRKGREIVCQTCQGSGYVGRTGVFELLVIDEVIAQLIAEGAQIKQIKSQARKNKMYYLQEEGLMKVIAGTTSLDEIIRGLRVDSK